MNLLKTIVGRRRKKAKVVPPGGNGRWYSLLPEPYCDNPEVCVLMVPVGSKGDVEIIQGFPFGILTSPRGTRRVLQVMDQDLDWADVAQAAEEIAGVPLAVHDFIGPVADIPDHFFHSATRYPMFFLKEAQWVEPLHVRNHLRSLTAVEEDNN